MQEPTLGVRNAQWMVSWKLLSERPVRSQRSVLKLEGRSYPRPGGSNQHESIPTNIQDVYPGNENTIVTSFSIGGILVGQTQGKEISVNLTYRYFGTCILYRRCVEPPTNLRGARRFTQKELPRERRTESGRMPFVGPAFLACAYPMGSPVLCLKTTII